MRSYEVKTVSTIDILTTAEVKAHLKVDTTADDTLIDNLRDAATNSAQEYTNRFFTSTTLTQYADKWSEIAELYKSPLQSITHIKYYDSDDSLQTLSSSVYNSDASAMPARIALAVNQSYPTTSDRIAAIRVEYIVGVTAANLVDNAIKQAVLLTIGHWYQNREAVIVGRIATELPMAAKYLLDQYKIQVAR